MGRKWEYVLAELVLSKALHARLGASMEGIGFEESLSKQDDLDKRLSRHVSSCREFRLDWQYMPIATDKGEGGGLSMSQTLFAFPDNQAFVGVPQVCGARAKLI